MRPWLVFSRPLTGIECPETAVMSCGLERLVWTRQLRVGAAPVPALG